MGDFDGAEATLTEAYESVAEGPPETRADCAKALVDLYRQWHEAFPDEGHDAEAAAWESKLPEAPDDDGGG